MTLPQPSICQKKFSCRTQVKLDPNTIRIIEPDELVKTVLIQNNSTMSNQLVAELRLDRLQVLDGTHTECNVVQPDLFLVMGPRLASSNACKEQTCMSNLIHTTVHSALWRL